MYGCWGNEALTELHTDLVLQHHTSVSEMARYHLVVLLCLSLCVRRQMEWVHPHIQVHVHVHVSPLWEEGSCNSIFSLYMHCSQHGFGGSYTLYLLWMTWCRSTPFGLLLNSSCHLGDNITVYGTLILLPLFLVWIYVSCGCIAVAIWLLLWLCLTTKTYVTHSCSTLW